jgi:hypothetical protein
MVAVVTSRKPFARPCFPATGSLLLSTRWTLIALIACVLLTQGVGSATAKPRPKPQSVTYTYTATAVPWPAYVTGVCHADVPQSSDDRVFTAPYAGFLSVKLSFQGNWNLALAARGTNMRQRESTAMGRVDRAPPPFIVDGGDAYSMAKGAAVTVRACNFVGAIHAEVTYTFSSLPYTFPVDDAHACRQPAC